MTKDIILTIDFAVLVRYENRFCDAAYIDQIIQKAAQRNVRTILWRTLAGARGAYRSRSVPSFEDQSPKWGPLLKAVDPLEAAVASAHKHGIKLFAWATLQDFHIVRQAGKIQNVTPFFDRNPHLYWSSLDGKSFHPGIPCYAYPEARQYYLDHIQEVLGYGVDGVYVCFRSHCGEPHRNDEFGYNEPWLNQLRDELGFVPSVEEQCDHPWLSYRLQKVRGTSYTHLLADIRNLVGDACPVWVGVGEEPDILIAGHSAKENPQRAFHRVRLDVRGWCRDGLVDTVIVVVSRLNPCDPSPAHIYRDTTDRYGKKLYPWLNLISHFRNSQGQAHKHTPPPDQLRKIVAAVQDDEVDGAVLHEVADLEFSYQRIYIDGKKDSKIEPQVDRDAQWDALLG